VVAAFGGEDPPNQLRGASIPVAVKLTGDGGMEALGFGDVGAKGNCLDMESTP
jgi:hypothetical protein